MKNIIEITEHELRTLLLNPEISGINGASFIGIDTTTIQKLKGGKKNPMQNRVEKHSVGNSVMVFQNKNSNGYENMIKRRLEAEGKNPESFSVGSRVWGERVEGTPLVEHKGENYLEVIFLKAGKSSYTLDSKPIKKDLIEGLDTDKKEGSQGELNNKVIIRTFKLKSISRITINKQTYIIRK
jgi:hypothetical protein